ncbi:MAG: TonB family protein [candidate division Zixibacteria bacterium]
MVCRNSKVHCSPYGAFELKAMYQRNLMMGSLATLSFVLLILFSFWLINAIAGEPDQILFESDNVETSIDIGPPPTVIQERLRVTVEQPKAKSAKFSIPEPVPDDEVMDDNVVLATRDELAKIVAPAISVGEGSGHIVVDMADDYDFPESDEFIPVEIRPEFIYKHQPEYPKLASLAGMEGKVGVRALVARSGDVRECIVQKSSGLQILDEAAVKAGLKCKFKPGIQNGQPVVCWVSFSYDFILTGN